MGKAKLCVHVYDAGPTLWLALWTSPVVERQREYVAVHFQNADKKTIYRFN